MVHPRGDVGGQFEGLACGDEDQAVGALGQEGPHLGGVGGVVQDDRDGCSRQMLVVELTQAPYLLVGGGPLPEEQLFARGPQPVQQVQQGVPGRQGCLARHIPAQIDHAGPAELVLERVRGACGESGTAGARGAVQDDDGRPGLGRGAGGVHPLGDLREFTAAARERAVHGGQMTEGLFEE